MHNVIDPTPKKDLLLLQEALKAEVDKDACENWQGICEPSGSYTGQEHSSWRCRVDSRDTG